MKRFNKFLALFLVVVMTVGMLPAAVSAAGNSNVILDESFESWADANTVITNDYSVRSGNKQTTSWNGANPAEGWSINVNEGQVLVQPVLSGAQDGNVSIKLTPNQDFSVSTKNRAKLRYVMPAEVYAAMEDGAEYTLTVYFKGENETTANIEFKTYDEAYPNWPNPNVTIGSDWTKYEYKFVLDKAKNAEKNFATLELFAGIKWHADNTTIGNLYIDNVSIVKVANYDYTTIESELAEGNATLQTDVDGTGNDLVLKSGKTLDLAGYTLTVDSLTALKGANIVDTVGGGLLVVDKEDLLLQKTNSYLPVKVDGGYAFVSVLNQHEETNDEVANTLVYSSRPSLGADYLADGAADNGLSVIFRLTWTNASNGTTTTMDVPCSEETIKQVYTQSGNAFELIVTGVDAVENLKVATVVCSDTGVAVVGEALAYTAG